MNIKLKFLIVFVLSVAIFNCSDEPTSIGGNLLDDDIINLKTITSVDDTLTQSSSYFHRKVSLGSADRLMIGKSDDDINASILIKFQTALPDSIAEDIRNNNITVNSAVLQLNQVYRFGEESAPFDFTIHKVTSDWALDFTADSALSYELDDLTITKEINDSITTVTIDNQLVFGWLQISADTSLPDDKGLYLKPAEGTQKVLGYQALTSSFVDFPVVSVVIEKPGAYIDTINFVTTSDVGVIEGNLPDVSNENIPLRSGFVINSKLVFDVSKVPENVIVNNAELILTLDTLESKFGTSFTNSVQTFFLFDSTNTDSLSSVTVSLGRSGNQFVGNITTFVRQWVLDNNQGVLLTTGSPFSGVELFSIKGSNAANISERPLLKITYTELK